MIGAKAPTTVFKATIKLILAAIAMSLAACGGGSSGSSSPDPDPPPPPPAQTIDSVVELQSYASSAFSSVENNTLQSLSTTAGSDMADQTCDVEFYTSAGGYVCVYMVVSNNVLVTAIIESLTGVDYLVALGTGVEESEFELAVASLADIVDPFVPPPTIDSISDLQVFVAFGYTNVQNNTVQSLSTSAFANPSNRTCDVEFRNSIGGYICAFIVVGDSVQITAVVESVSGIDYLVAVGSGVEQSAFESAVEDLGDIVDPFVPPNTIDSAAELQAFVLQNFINSQNNSTRSLSVNAQNDPSDVDCVVEFFTAAGGYICAQLVVGNSNVDITAVVESFLGIDYLVIVGSGVEESAFEAAVETLGDIVDPFVPPPTIDTVQELQSYAASSYAAALNNTIQSLTTDASTDPSNYSCDVEFQTPAGGFICASLVVSNSVSVTAVVQSEQGVDYLVAVGAGITENSFDAAVALLGNIVDPFVPPPTIDSVQELQNFAASNYSAAVNNTTQALTTDEQAEFSSTSCDVEFLNSVGGYICAILDSSNQILVTPVARSEEGVDYLVQFGSGTEEAAFDTAVALLADIIDPYVPPETIDSILELQAHAADNYANSQNDTTQSLTTNALVDPSDLSCDVEFLTPIGGYICSQFSLVNGVTVTPVVESEAGIDYVVVVGNGTESDEFDAALASLGDIVDPVVPPETIDSIQELQDYAALGYSSAENDTTQSLTTNSLVDPADQACDVEFETSSGGYICASLVVSEAVSVTPVVQSENGIDYLVAVGSGVTEAAFDAAVALLGDIVDPFVPPDTIDNVPDLQAYAASAFTSVQDDTTQSLTIDAMVDPSNVSCDVEFDTSEGGYICAYLDASSGVSVIPVVQSETGVDYLVAVGVGEEEASFASAVSMLGDINDPFVPPPTIDSVQELQAFAASNYSSAQNSTTQSLTTNALVDPADVSCDVEFLTSLGGYVCAYLTGSNNVSVTPVVQTENGVDYLVAVGSGVEESVFDTAVSALTDIVDPFVPPPTIDSVQELQAFAASNYSSVQNNTTQSLTTNALVDPADVSCDVEFVTPAGGYLCAYLIGGGEVSVTPVVQTENGVDYLVAVGSGVEESVFDTAVSSLTDIVDPFVPPPTIDSVQELQVFAASNYSSVQNSTTQSLTTNALVDPSDVNCDVEFFTASGGYICAYLTGSNSVVVTPVVQTENGVDYLVAVGSGVEESVFDTAVSALADIVDPFVPPTTIDSVQELQAYADSQYASAQDDTTQSLTTSALVDPADFDCDVEFITTLDGYICAFFSNINGVTVSAVIESEEGIDYVVEVGSGVEESVFDSAVAILGNIVDPSPECVEEGSTGGSGLGGYCEPREAGMVPDHLYNIILGRPTNSTMIASVLAHEDMSAYITYGTLSGVPSLSTATIQLISGEPYEFEMNSLVTNSRYYYQLNYTLPGESLQTSPEYQFHTPRANGNDFVFTVQSDSHLDENTIGANYIEALTNSLNESPDFHLALGDTFMTDKYVEYELSEPQYLAQRYYFGSFINHSAPLFFALGNHDAEGTNNAARALWARAMRNLLYPNPAPDGDFYVGNPNDPPPGEYWRNYYSWEWGNSLFVALDPFAYGQNGQGWNPSLGRAQYDWLVETLENSTATFKFIYLHNLVGGFGPDRGGAEASFYYEWGGLNEVDDSYGFDIERPGWGTPIHDVLAANDVTMVLHGHDHMYIRQDRDGIVYQLVPQPGHRAGGINNADDYGYLSGDIVSGSGTLTVTVSDDEVLVEFIDSRDAGRSGDLLHSYTIPAP